MSAQVAADLRAAAEMLRRDGWCQRDFEDEQGRHCLAGALHFLFPDDGLRRVDVSLTFRRHIGDLPITYNDAPGRTADEVIAALEAAADAAEAQQ